MENQEIPKDELDSNKPKVDNSQFRSHFSNTTENIKPKEELVDHSLPPTVSAKPIKEAMPSQTEVVQKEALLKKKKSKYLNKRFAIFGSLFLGGSFLLFVIAFLMIYTVTSPENNPFIALFGLNVEEWIPLIINIVSFCFGVMVLIAFFIGIIGVFRIAMAPKDNAIERRKGLIMSMIGSVTLIALIVLWMFSYIWLDSKRDEYIKSAPVNYIQTTPEETTGLTAPLTIRFDASAIAEVVNPLEKEILSYLWDFGDGTKQTGQSVSHEYLKKGPIDGSYNINLSVRYRDIKTGTDGVEEFTKTIVFDNEKVASSFEASVYEGSYPLEVTFDASTSTDPDGVIVDYLWDFDGDGKFDDGVGVDASYTFERVGTYEVSLQVVDDSNDFSISTKEIKVLESTEPTATIEIKGAIGRTLFVDDEYTFDASGSVAPQSEITKYSWDFGNGTKANTRTFSHKFTETGSYLVQLTIETNLKQKAFASIEIDVVSKDQSPLISLNTIPAMDKAGLITGSAPLMISFDASNSTDSDNDIISYEWDFDANGSADAFGSVVSKQFNEQGEYAVKLTVADSKGNESVKSVMVSVDKQGLKAKLNASVVEGEVPLQVTFDASGSSYLEGEILSYEWDFGDGTKPRFGDSKITYEYSKVGEFNASVKIKSNDGLTQTTSIGINIRPVAIRACFEADAYAGKAPLSLVFRSGCSTGTISNYSWKLDGIIVPANPSHRLSYTFENAGVYQLSLTVRDHEGVVDTFTKQITITD